MVQYLKEKVRNSIIDSGTKTFAKHGYEGTRMIDIAKDAGMTSGNLYRYYKNKSDLFDAIIDVSFADYFLKLLRTRAQSLSSFMLFTTTEDVSKNSAQELLDFWIKHRLKVVIILHESKGSKYEGFRSIVIQELVKLTKEFIKNSDSVKIKKLRSKELTFFLESIFENTLNMIVKILAGFEDEKQIRRLISSFWGYQVAGLKTFVVDGTDKKQRPD